MKIVKIKPEKNKVAERLKVIRKNLGFTIEEMANRLGLSKGTFNSYLRGLALPPEEVIDKLIMLAQVKKEWIYFGDESDFVSDYILALGYDKFLKENPNTLNSIVRDFKAIMLIESAKSENVTDLNSKYDLMENIILKLLAKYYDSAFNSYVRESIKDISNELNSFPKYSKDMSNSEWFINNLIKNISTNSEELVYGDYEKIRELALDELESLKYWVFGNTIKNSPESESNLVEKLIEKLSDDKSTHEFLNDLSELLEVPYRSAEDNKELIKLFRSIIPKLRQLREE